MPVCPYVYPVQKECAFVELEFTAIYKDAHTSVGEITMSNKDFTVNFNYKILKLVSNKFALLLGEAQKKNSLELP